MLHRWLSLQNLVSRRSALGQEDIVVSLTSFGDRITRVHLAIESIARGTVKPGRLILWVAHEEQSIETPSLRRLRRRGLEIRPTTDVGSHTKYYPYAASRSRHEQPLAIIDDDSLYPGDWLAGLLSTSALAPGALVAYRCRRIRSHQGRLSPYSEWPIASPSDAEILLFMTGVGGALLPPVLLDELCARGTSFTKMTGRCDDAHLNSVARDLELRMVLCEPTRRSRLDIEGTPPGLSAADF